MKILTMLVSITLFACASTPDRMDMDDRPRADIPQFEDGHQMLEHLTNTPLATFKAFDDVYNEALEQLKHAQTPEARARLLEEYKDVIWLSNGTYAPLLQNEYYRKIANRDRLYISSGKVHKVLDDRYLIVTDISNRARLTDINSIDEVAGAEFTVMEYQTTVEQLTPERNLASLTTCPDYFKVDYFSNPSGCNNDRRIWVEARAFWIVSGSYILPWVNAHAWPELRNSLCNWKGYSNPVYTQNTSFTAYYNVAGNEYLSSYTIGDFSGTATNVTIFDNSVGPWFYLTGGNYFLIRFYEIHMEASSQGVGANDPTHYAVIDCHP